MVAVTGWRGHVLRNGTQDIVSPASPSFRPRRRTGRASVRPPSPLATPTTTKGKARPVVVAADDPGSGRPPCSSTSTAPVRSGAIALRSSARSVSALRDSRIARRYPADVDDPRCARWADSGAMALTGLLDEPLGPPSGLVEGIDRLASSFPGVDALALLGERAALMGLWRRGATSCGGSCRLLRCAATGSWPSRCPVTTTWTLVAGLARARRRHRRRPPPCGPRWPRGVAEDDPDALVARAQLLGLPVARVGEAAGTERTCRRAPGAPGRRPSTARPDRPRSWSTCRPCGPVLSAATCWPVPAPSVVKVESTQRPDGARRGSRGVLRPPQRTQAVGRPRPAESRWRPAAARPRPPG